MLVYGESPVSFAAAAVKETREDSKSGVEESKKGFCQLIHTQSPTIVAVRMPSEQRSELKLAKLRDPETKSKLTACNPGNNLAAAE